MKPESNHLPDAIPSESVVFKIVNRREWENAVVAGQYAGSAADVRDGFIHLSAAHQVGETWKKHFAGQDDLLLVAVAVEKTGDALKWEASRGGDLFPHLYGPLKMDAVVGVQDFDGRGPAIQGLRNSSSG